MTARPATGILVGPGVLANLGGVRSLAEAVGVAVINTWGAKGTFRWDDPFHGGTAGLQERDFELAGLGDVDVLLTSGLDPDEVTTTPWAGRAEVVDVPVADLGAFATDWPHEPFEPTRPRLYTELASVVQPMYSDPASPAARLHAINASLPANGMVFAPPGLLGFWVARTWSTTIPGSVVVPGVHRARPHRAPRRRGGGPWPVGDVPEPRPRRARRRHRPRVGRRPLHPDRAARRRGPAGGLADGVATGV